MDNKHIDDEPAQPARTGRGDGHCDHELDESPPAEHKRDFAREETRRNGCRNLDLHGDEPAHGETEPDERGHAELVHNEPKPKARAHSGPVRDSTGAASASTEGETKRNEPKARTPRA